MERLIHSFTLSCEVRSQPGSSLDHVMQPSTIRTHNAVRQLLTLYLQDIVDLLNVRVGDHLVRETRAFVRV